MNLELVILDGPEAGRRIPVPSAPVTLGRAPAAAMAFPDDGFISSVHLSIQGDAEGVRITDLRSTNGTFLNGERVTSGLAGIGDIIQIGTMTMQVAVVSKAQAPAAAPVFSSSNTPPPVKPFEATMFGSSPLPKMDIPAPPPFNPSVAATTTIPQISFGGVEHLRRLDSAKPEAEALQQKLRATLESIPGQLYIMVNAAADESIPAMLAMGDINLAKHSLWQEDPTARWAPYLVPAVRDSDLLRVILERGWGQNWISVFGSMASLDELLAHFAKFLKVQMEQTGNVYFRFYDPKVLREFLPSGNPAEIAMFFGPVSEWILESETKATFLRATKGFEGLQLQTINVTS